MKRGETGTSGSVKYEGPGRRHWCGSAGPVLSKATDLHPPERPEELSQAPTPECELGDVPVLDLGLPSAPLLNFSR